MNHADTGTKKGPSSLGGEGADEAFARLSGAFACGLVALHEQPSLLDLVRPRAGLSLLELGLSAGEALRGHREEPAVDRHRVAAHEVRRVVALVVRREARAAVDDAPVILDALVLQDGISQGLEALLVERDGGVDVGKADVLVVAEDHDAEIVERGAVSMQVEPEVAQIDRLLERELVFEVGLDALQPAQLLVRGSGVQNLLPRGARKIALLVIAAREICLDTIDAALRRDDATVTQMLINFGLQPLELVLLGADALVDAFDAALDVRLPARRLRAGPRLHQPRLVLLVLAVCHFQPITSVELDGHVPVGRDVAEENRLRRNPARLPVRVKRVGVGCSDVPRRFVDGLADVAAVIPHVMEQMHIRDVLDGGLVPVAAAPAVVQQGLLPLGLRDEVGPRLAHGQPALLIHGHAVLSLLRRVGTHQLAALCLVQSCLRRSIGERPSTAKSGPT